MLLNKFSFYVLLILSLAFSSIAKADELKPTWEVGLALGGQYLADYRGSSSYNARVLPVPFFIYRGNRIKLDRRGLRGDLLDSKAWEVNISGEVSLAGGQEENALRSGMIQLDPTFEVGPSFNIALDGNVKDDGWLLRLPVRTVFAAGPNVNGVEYVGYLFNPKITYENDPGGDAWRFRTSLGFSYGSELYHDYYYQVDSAFVTEARPFFNAKAGYSGSYFKAGVSKRSASWRYGVSIRYDNISGTDFSESPLVETDHYFSVSFILAKFLWASKY